MKIIYSDEAIRSLQEVVSFLEENWTQIEMDLFESEFEKFLLNVKDAILTYQKVDGFKNLQFALIGNKQVKIYFYRDEYSLEILLFLPSKADPSRLSNLLK